MLDYSMEQEQNSDKRLFKNTEEDSENEPEESDTKGKNKVIKYKTKKNNNEMMKEIEHWKRLSKEHQDWAEGNEEELRYLKKKLKEEKKNSKIREEEIWEHIKERKN
jgi:hypothetical protein